MIHAEPNDVRFSGPIDEIHQNLREFTDYVDELVAKRHGKMPYSEYLHSERWQERRVRALELARVRCQVCNSDQDLDVHHRTYERRGNELDCDLTVLCRECHTLFHEHGRMR